MPKKSVFEDNSTSETQAMESLLKKLIIQQKPKQKRVISEERKEQLRAQLVKGRENSIKSRTNKPKDTPTPPNTPEPIQKEIKKEIKQENNNDINKLESKFDDLITHMKDMKEMQRETLQYKKEKRTKKPEEVKSEVKVNDEDNWLFAPKKKDEPLPQGFGQAKPSEPKPKEEVKPPEKPQQPQQPAPPAYYYIHGNRNKKMFV